MPQAPSPIQTSEQYALELFRQTIGLKGTDATIVDAATDLIVKKNNILIDIGSLGLLGRRALNVMDFLASMAPAEVTDFDCDLGLFRFLLNFDSRNYKHLREALRETQKCTVLVEVEGKTRSGEEKTDFVSISVVNLVAVAGGRVYFQFPSAIRRLQKTQRGYTLLSLRTTASFTSQYAHALYERLRSVAFKGSPTEWLTVEEARRWAGASGDKYADEFKAFKRRVLEIAKAQINDFSDLFIDYETRSAPGSKKIAHIRFSFREQVAKGSPSFHQTEVRKALYNTLRGEFGLGTREIEDIARDPQEFTPERIQAAIDFVRHRMKRNGQKKVHSPGRLLIKALKEGWTVPSAEAQDFPSGGVPAGQETAVTRWEAAQPAAAAVPADDGAEALQQRYERNGEEGFRLYQASDAERREQLRATFARSHAFRALQSKLERTKGAPLTDEELEDSPRLRLAFGTYVHTQFNKPAGEKARGRKAQSSLFES